MIFRKEELDIFAFRGVTPTGSVKRGVHFLTERARTAAKEIITHLKVPAVNLTMVLWLDDEVYDTIIDQMPSGFGVVQDEAFERSEFH